MLDCYSFVIYREYIDKSETAGYQVKNSYFKAGFFGGDMMEVREVGEQLIGCSTNPYFPGKDRIKNNQISYFVCTRFIL